MMKKKIIFKPENYEKINAVLEQVQGKCRERCIDVEIMREVFETIHDKIDISKRAMEGTVINVDYHADKFPNAYKYAPKSTKFVAEYHAGKWYIENIYRSETCRHSDKGICLMLSDSAKEAILDCFSSFNRYGF